MQGHLQKHNNRLAGSASAPYVKDMRPHSTTTAGPPRKTQQRDAIRQVFLQHTRPLRITEVIAYGRESAPTLDQATVYRNLKRLVAEGWLLRLTHPDLGTLYERAGKDHHHHFHCRKCDQVLELPGCGLKDGRLAPRGFVVQDHEVFLSGVCADCGRR
jgi:Fur family transcriptional regulator, ferric uptake regulator